MSTPGQRAYERYCESVGWVSVGGDQLPAWSEMRENLRRAWEHAADDGAADAGAG